MPIVLPLSYVKTLLGFRQFWSRCGQRPCWRMLAKVGNMLKTAAALTAVTYFPFDQIGRASVGTCALRLVRLPWCHRSSVIVTSRFVSGPG
jgi:hypothetical protein